MLFLASVGLRVSPAVPYEGVAIPTAADGR
jgi:hypothetical protein